MAPLVSTTEFALLVRLEGLNRGLHPDHPGLQGRFGRRVVNLLVDGHVPCQRSHGRMFVSAEHVTTAADLLGLRPAPLSAEPAAIAA